MEGKPSILGVGPEALPNVAGEPAPPVIINDQEQASARQAIPAEVAPLGHEPISSPQPLTAEPITAPPPISLETLLATKADLPADQLEDSLAQQFEQHP
ncbi:MAG TPA: hypothetical protein VLE93_02000 [Candidatus Saccharimonadales bacterium]|nr:hypothetical protein [Candidatus Saccharimonadales bacterium]